MKNLKIFLLPLISVLTILGGVFVLWLAYRLSRDTKASLAWPSVKGRVLKIDLLVIGPSPHPTYHLDLSYAYSVASKAYLGEKAHLYQITTKAEADKVLDQFHVGDEVSVCYKPTDPNVSVLIPGPRENKPYHEYAMGFVLIAVGLVLVFTNLDAFKELYSLFLG